MNPMMQSIPLIPDSFADMAIDVESTQLALESAAIELQSRYASTDGERYRVEDLKTALTRWLELSIESLVEDVLFHTIDGDRAYAFNRHGFEMQLRKLQPESISEPISPALRQAA